MTDTDKDWFHRASGIVRLRTEFLPLPGVPRRKVWRPPLKVSLGILLSAAIIASGGLLHRRWLDARLGQALSANDSAPFEIQRIRRDLAGLEGDENDLARSLDARLQYAESQKARDFYILIDTKARRFDFKYGDRVVRSCAVEVGAPRTVETRSGKRWTFAPITGAFSVRQKLENGNWTAPEWAYAMRGRAAPDPLPEVPNGLGQFVLVFADGYVIHSAPPAQSPLAGAKPGSFLVPAGDLAAIWKRLGPETRVYIF